MAEMWLYCCIRMGDNGCSKTMSATHIKLYIKTADIFPAEPLDERQI